MYLFETVFGAKITVNRTMFNIIFTLLTSVRYLACFGYNVEKKLPQRLEYLVTWSILKTELSGCLKKRCSKPFWYCSGITDLNIV